MKKGSRFLIAFATAGITFSALLLGLGKDQFNKYGNRHHQCYSHHTHHCDAEQTPTK